MDNQRGAHSFIRSTQLGSASDHESSVSPVMLAPSLPTPHPPSSYYAHHPPPPNPRSSSSREPPPTLEPIMSSMRSSPRSRYDPPSEYKYPHYTSSNSPTITSGSIHESIPPSDHYSGSSITAHHMSAAGLSA